MVEEIKTINSKGFSLIEVMIAMAIFAVFIVSFITGQGFNVLQSETLRTDLKLAELTKLKMNEILINPPNLKETLTSASNSEKFEDYPGYDFQVLIKKNVLPDYKKLKGKDEKESNNESSAIEAKIYTQVKKNLEKLVWQIKVTVIRKETGEKFSLSTWIYNHKNDQVVFQGL